MKYEHTFIGIEGTIDTNASDLMYSFMLGARSLALDLDELIDSKLPGEGWELASHDVAIIGSKTLTMIIFRRPLQSKASLN